MGRAVWLVGIAALLAGSCAGTISGGSRTIVGSGNVNSVQVDISTEPFGRVVLAGQGDVRIAVGDRPELTIETDDNIQAYLEVETRDGTLVISTRSGITLDPSSGIIYAVVAPGFDAIAVSGSGIVTAPGLTVASMDVTLDGSGEVRLDDLDTTMFAAEIAGSGIVTASGVADSADLAVPGSGSIMAGDLEVGAAAVDVSGSGNVEVWARDVLSIAISGSGTVGYYGSPRSLEESVPGSGVVIERGAHP